MAAIKGSGGTSRLGDDSNVASAEMLEPEDRPVVAELSGDELDACEDIRQLGRKAETWYRSNLIGQMVVNTLWGMKVQFRREGAKKISGRKGDVLMRIVPALKQTIASGTVTSIEPNTKGNSDIAAWHTISATVSREGTPRDIIVKIKEARDGHLHYDLSWDMSDGAKQIRASGRNGDTAIGLQDNPV